jgi:hypothetical protein
MLSSLVDDWVRWTSGAPAFQIYAKARRERRWRVISVYATNWRDLDSSWPPPFWAGTCITWTHAAIATGCDFAEAILREQGECPASRQYPLTVPGGRLRDKNRRAAAGCTQGPTACEILAHECGHTWQALRLGWAYWPAGALLTLFREGPNWWNRFENEASEQGQFGGIVSGSVCPSLMQCLNQQSKA